jgi:predicted unusual protein kinase regulating ubiquinone biosynthesis (AarF/ABC1/UbiB family)
MSPNISELIAALPDSGDESKAAALPASLAKASLRPIPIGRLSRLTTLGTLQAKIGAAYLFHWLRGWFRNAEANERDLAETHWRTALRLLDSMSYLRGGVMKVGQTLANFPDIAPQQFVDTLQQLHFEAPPMHWSLLSEMVRNELGDDPENVFAEFDKQAFAAASLGQVHRARLKSGEEVAVKIQYPGIARAIQSDFRNFFLFLLPNRLSRDWEYVKDQCEDLRQRLEQETDYELEAANLAKARALFRDADGIAIPRVFPQYSTARILTMERLDGLHITQYLERGPTQEARNEVARKMLRAWYRLLYAGRMFYADFHPGNFLVLDDGRLGVVDFGFIMTLDDDEWETFRRIDRALTTGQPEDRLEVVKLWSYVDDHETDRVRILDEYAQWCWQSRYLGGDYDFADEADFRRGFDLFMELVRKRYTRARPNTPVLSRCQFGWRSIFYQLKAKFDVQSIAEEEVKATGWDRSDYA